MSFSIIPASQIIKNFKLDGPVQNFIAQQVLSRSEPYIPKRSGNLINSGQVTGSEIIWNAPYAASQYYSHKSTQIANLRGGFWFERMKNAQINDIIHAAADFAGGVI